MLSWDEARLNDKIKLSMTREEFDKKYKADDIRACLPGETCHPEKDKVQIVSYKGAKYEMKDNILRFMSIDFSERRGMYFSIKGDWFDHTTTLKSFMKTYPVASEYIYDDETEDGEPLEVITLLPAESGPDAEWRFCFANGKLRSIENWLSCK